MDMGAVDFKAKTKYYENVISLLLGNVYCKDKNLHYVWCNNNFAKILKLSNPSQIVGKTDYDFLDKNLADYIVRNDTNVMEKKHSISYEEMGIDENGNKAAYFTIKTTLLDDKSNVIGLLGISFDITDRKKAEEYRLKSEAAEKVAKFSNLVAGSIAHELKNPLAGIRMQMQTLQNIDFKKMPQQTTESLLKDMAVSIIKSVDATTYVIDGMLKKVRTFATDEVHHKEFEEISIFDDIENLLSTYPFENDQKDLVKIVYGARYSYLGDMVLTAHVLGNLMKNALHAIAQTSKAKVNIIIETKVEDDFNILTFRDTATGIPKDFQEKIFDQFETKKDVHGGTGLGLAFCKSVMEGYGGSITCNSEEGKYTEFVLKFPKTKSHNKSSLKTQLKKGIAKGVFPKLCQF